MTSKPDPNEAVHRAIQAAVARMMKAQEPTFERVRQRIEEAVASSLAEAKIDEVVERVTTQAARALTENPGFLDAQRKLLEAALSTSELPSPETTVDAILEAKAELNASAEVTRSAGTKKPELTAAGLVSLYGSLLGSLAVAHPPKSDEDKLVLYLLSLMITMLIVTLGQMRD